MTTTAGHSFYIGPIGSFYDQVNDTGSWEPLVLKTGELTGMSNCHSKKGWQCKKIDRKSNILFCLILKLE
jgi:hypothetical protein